jgi:HPt (histidine-containing phosphotransfer) domain-containing protein
LNQSKLPCKWNINALQSADALFVAPIIPENFTTAPVFAPRHRGQIFQTPVIPMPVIDLQAIENLRSLNPDDNDEFLRELTGIFLEDTPKRLAELDTSLVSGDIGAFTRAAHSIKGSASNLGAIQLRSAAEKLEHHSRKEGLTGVTEMIAAIKTEFNRASDELKKLTAKA